MEKQEDRLKKCVRCPDKMDTLDEHDECYKHRICNESFPCKISKNWSKEHRSLIMKMIEKSVQKTIKLNKLSQPACIDGLTDFKDISPPVEAAVRASNDDTVTENTPDNSTCMVDISAIVQEQVQLQIQNLFKKFNLLESLVLQLCKTKGHILTNSKVCRSDVFNDEC
ncbi:unnamed protein product [Mytilus coruscus]|uniref:Uncharacterized protein n=1 Tax=Mytilus coruscus TaxID=42192 RepID=A0A6J8EHJ6_MYTCO|nr:unnamed protein product [Mytilus coruscus]